MNILNSRQNAKLNSHDVVEEYLDENPDIVATNVAFKNAFEEVKPLLAQIWTTAQKSGKVITGIAAGKKTSKRTLSQKAAKIAGQICAYAAKTGNAELKDASDFVFSDFNRLKEGEVALRCQTIHDLGTEHKSALDIYGVTEEKLAALQMAIDGYTRVASKPRAAIADRSVTKAEVKEMFEQVDTVFTEQLDLLIEDFAETHPTFVAGYKARRKLVDPKSKSKLTPEPTGDDGDANKPA